MRPDYFEGKCDGNTAGACYIPVIFFLITITFEIASLQHMADDGGRRASRNTVSATHLKEAKKKFPVFNVEATIEYKRLHPMRTKLLGGSKEQAMYHHLCLIREGWMHFNS